MLTSYTSFDEVRSAIGVAEEEITDDVLSQTIFELVLGFDLGDIGIFVPTIQDHYLALIDTVATPAPSVDEGRFISILRVYATYVVARHLLRTLEMFAPQTIKDAKTELARVADPYADVKAGVEVFYQQMRARLLAAYLVLFPSATPNNAVSFSPLLAVGLGVDPVTGA